MNGKQMIADGWVPVRIEGSHHIMAKVGILRPVPVPVHGKKDIGADLLAAIQRQTGVKLK